MNDKEHIYNQEGFSCDGLAVTDMVVLQSHLGAHQPNDHFGHVHAQMPKATLSPPKAHSTDPEHSAQMGRFQFCMTPRGRVLAEDEEGMRDEDGGDAAASAQE
ncbi:hypothetical protein PG989_016192 [Apiospora arundinis]